MGGAIENHKETTEDENIDVLKKKVSLLWRKKNLVTFESAECFISNVTK